MNSLKIGVLTSLIETKQKKNIKNLKKQGKNNINKLFSAKQRTPAECEANFKHSSRMWSQL